MDTFENVWTSSAYNSFFFVKVGVIVLAVCISFFIRSWKLWNLALIACVVYVLSVVEVEEKWRIRSDAAVSMKEKDSVSLRDTGNREMTLKVAAPLQSLAVVLLVAAIPRLIRKKQGGKSRAAVLTPFSPDIDGK